MQLGGLVLLKQGGDHGVLPQRPGARWRFEHGLVGAVGEGHGHGAEVFQCSLKGIGALFGGVKVELNPGYGHSCKAL